MEPTGTELRSLPVPKSSLENKFSYKQATSNLCLAIKWKHNHKIQNHNASLVWCLVTGDTRKVPPKITLGAAPTRQHVRFCTNLSSSLPRAPRLLFHLSSQTTSNHHWHGPKQSKRSKTALVRTFLFVDSASELCKHWMCAKNQLLFYYTFVLFQQQSEQ